MSNPERVFIEGVTVDGAGDAWVAGTGEAGPDALLEFNAVGLALRASGYPNGLQQVLFDANGNLWGNSAPSFASSQLYQINTNTGAIASTYSTAVNFSPLVADSAGNVYGCVTGTPGSNGTGTSLNVFNLSNPTAPVGSNPIDNNGRGCGIQMVLDGQGRIFAITSLTAPGVIDEFTTTDTLLSPAAGYTGTGGTDNLSNAEPPTLNPDASLLSPVNGLPQPTSPTVVGAGIDASGNLWLVNADTGNPNSTPTGPNGNVLVEFVGIAAPVVTPTSQALASKMVGVRP